MSKVSVIIPVYNTEKYLKSCLDSVINQTLSDIEIICINDGSTDNSLDILEEYANKDDRIKIINQKNQGVSEARNNGIKLAKSDYFILLDSDDSIENTICEKSYNAIVKNNADINIIGFNIYNNNNLVHTDRELLQNYRNNLKLESVLLFLMPCAGGKMYKKSFLENNDIKFNKKICFAEDSIFNFECMFKGAKFSIVPECLYNITQYREGSATSSKNGSKKEVDTFAYFINTKVYKQADLIHKKFYLMVFMNLMIIQYNNFPNNRQFIKKQINRAFKIIKKTNKEIAIECSNYQEFLKFIDTPFLQKIFSAKNIDNHKVITILGIRFKFKKTINYNKRYNNILKRLRSTKNKIKIAFLVSENQKWGYQSLYDLLASDNRFEPIILISLLTTVHHGFDNTRNNLKENFDFFKSKGMNVDFCYKNGEYIPLETFKPDIVFYEQMWDLPPHYMPDYVSNFALTCHVNYGLAFFNNENNFTPYFHQCLWRYFVDNFINIKRYKKYDRIKSKNCLYLGYPKLDAYLENKSSNISISNCSNKKIIIYAPHHSFEENGLKLATFKTSGKFILDIAKRNNDIIWIFKPHPRFKIAVLQNHIMSESDIDVYYKEWENLGYVYTQGDYISIFKDSDLLITDCASFLGEYLPTKNPIIRLVNSEATEFNEFGKRISNCCYNVKNNEELEKLFNQIVRNEYDPKIKYRLNTIKILMDEKKSSSSKIFEYLKKVVK